jgi:hypothetical protein
MVHEVASLHGEEIKPATRTVTRNGKTYEQNTANIGKQVESDSTRKTPEVESDSTLAVKKVKSDFTIFRTCCGLMSGEVVQKSWHETEQKRSRFRAPIATQCNRMRTAKLTHLLPKLAIGLG